MEGYVVEGNGLNQQPHICYRASLATMLHTPFEGPASFIVQHSVYLTSCLLRSRNIFPFDSYRNLSPQAVAYLCVSRWKCSYFSSTQVVISGDEPTARNRSYPSTSTPIAAVNRIAK